MATFTITQTPNATNLILIPNAAGCVTGLAPVGEVNNWACVDDPVGTPDEDATYVHSDSINILGDLYNVPGHPAALTGVINYIRVVARAKSHQYSQSPDGVYKIIMTENNCEDVYVSEDKNLLTSWSNYSNVWRENPRREALWTWDDIDGLQIGIVCSSLTVNSAPYSIVLNDQGLDTNEWDGQGSGSGENYWYTEYGTCAGCGGTAPGDKRLYCAFQDSTLGAEYTIVKVSLITQTASDVGRTPYPCYLSGDCNPCTDETPTGKLMLRTHAVEYFGDNFGWYYDIGNWATHILAYTNNPNTSDPWTWTEVNDIIAGAYADDFDDTDFCGGNHILNKNIKIVVDYLGDVNPDIRTTQVYAEVNYTPEDSTCTLNKPTQISTNHSRNTKMLNFWNGEREVYDLNRGGKSMVLTGSEQYTDACKRIICIRDMSRIGASITVAGLSLDYLNGSYKIRSFGWNKISECPEHFHWILELEDTEL